MCCRTVIIALAKPHTLWLLWLRFNIEMRFKLPAQPHMFLCELSLQCLFLPVAQSTGGCRMLSMLGEGEWEFGSSLQFPKDSYLYTTTGPPPPKHCPMQFMATGGPLFKARQPPQSAPLWPHITVKAFLKTEWTCLLWQILSETSLEQPIKLKGLKWNMC